MEKQYRVANKKKTERLYKKAENIAELLEVYDSMGERIFFAWKENDELKEISYANFAEKVRNTAKGFVEMYGDENKRIAVIGENSPYWVETYLAVLLSGNTIVPMDKELSPKEISKFLEYAEVSAIAFAPSFSETFAEYIIDAKHPTVKCLIPFGGDMIKESKKTKVVPLKDIEEIGHSSIRALPEDYDMERCCELLFTSGTTGSSKCVMLCMRNIFSDVMSACESVIFVPDDVLVSVLPLHHTYELMCTLGASCYGAKICICQSLRYVMKAFKEFRPTALILVPLFVSTMYKRVLTEAKKAGKEKALLAASKVTHILNFAKLDLSEMFFKDVKEAFGGRLEKIICGGAALNPELICAFDSFGIGIYEGYGITECSPLVAVTPYYKRKPGSVGRSVPCCEMRIDGEEIGESGFVTGEIQVKGDNVMLGYMNNDAANEDAFTEDGWFRTGDVGYIDNDGYLFITGRQKSVIVLNNGKNVFPEEIEEYMDKIDEIEEAVVVGREEDDTVKLVAVIFPASEKYPELDEASLRGVIQSKINNLNKSLPSFKQIHKIEFRKTEFEKTTTRKIKRYLVK